MYIIYIYIYHNISYHKKQYIHIYIIHYLICCTLEKQTSKTNTMMIHQKMLRMLLRMFLLKIGCKQTYKDLGPQKSTMIKIGCSLYRRIINIWVCLKIGYIPNYSHLVGIMIINHWVIGYTTFSDTPIYKIARKSSNVETHVSDRTSGAVTRLQQIHGILGTSLKHSYIT